MQLSEIDRARIFLFDFLKSLFLEEPTPEKRETWLKVLEKIAGQTDFEPLDQALLGLKEFLKKTDPDQLKEEYYELFVNPTREKPLVLTASYFIDGKAIGPTLAKLRKNLNELGITRSENFKESEDSLVFLLDLMIILIEKSCKDNIYFKHLENIFEKFLLPCAEGAYERLTSEEKSSFYRKCAEVLRSYLELEKRFLTEG
ncbi:hypothetical protein Thein_1823 [Thermodesulfatator indicus DSM 15286]|uniref:PH domain-containing protein n=1 Tax=Thermodesulfatator indicus (strain DSM 15286 / JCM 11887 / CIR29812) TaxID=667014 RepID=F8ABY6_THEID|nr:molecular chaperone TorD family protein [Thermodesulfatator indicus]AEH45678.1 hypothetical protein Thein_1823 [Thermodesulfatator indicus DSM 15286]